MTLKTIIAALVIGSSSLASAQPISSARFSGSLENELRIRDHRIPARASYARSWYEPAYRVRPYQSRWINLGTFDVTTDGRAQIEFDVGDTPMSQLFLRQNGWKSRLFRIDIMYANGRTRSIEMDTYLGDVKDRGSMTLNVDLPRSRVPVSRILITASNARESSFSVYGI